MPISFKSLAVALVLGAIWAGPRTANAAERVEVLSGEAKLQAVLYRPVGPGPFPAVVALHTCDGLSSGPGNPQGVDERYAEWAEHLVAAGFAVLFPDSFGSRGLAAQCGVRQRPVRASRARIGDAFAARNWLQSQPWVIANRVSLLGWSHGGTTALWTIRRRGNAGERKNPDFRSAVALYPNCQRATSLAWSARVPTLILIGRADDWTSANACEQMVAGARGRSAGTQIKVYPGALHDFDRKDLAPQERTGIANTISPSGRVHIGTNAAARADAMKRVPEWFAR